MLIGQISQLMCILGTLNFTPNFDFPFITGKRSPDTREGLHHAPPPVGGVDRVRPLLVPLDPLDLTNKSPEPIESTPDIKGKFLKVFYIFNYCKWSHHNNS